MKVDGNKPLVAQSARGLGIRAGHDLVITPDGHAEPGTGGMSVASGWRFLPLFRIPARLRRKVPDATGNNADACWAFDEGPFESGPVNAELVLNVDREHHGTVQPAARMLQAEYETAIASTRDDWTIDET